jgi:protein-L-isoaspartate(D-aspartate) O-methyltransferase
MLTDLLRKRIGYATRGVEAYFDAELNARLVADAERYYRIMYYGAVESWNLRDRHMFETLERVLRHYGPESRGVVWAHNSHLGAAAATELGERGELNLGRTATRRSAARAGSRRSCSTFGSPEPKAFGPRWPGPASSGRSG